MVEQALHPILGEAVRRLAQQYQWQFLTESAWVQAALAIDPAPVDAKMARRACLTVYSQVLYQACQDPACWEQAYRELYDYLWPQAQYKAPHLANDAAQIAIELIFRSFRDPNLAKCNNPKTFLYFAQFKLRDAFSRLRKQPDQRHDVVDFSLDWSGNPDDPLGQLPDPALTPEEQVVEEETNQARAQWRASAIQRIACQVLRCLSQLWLKKRLQKQLKALIITFLDGLDDLAIAARLETTHTNVQVLRSRGLDKLRGCLSQHLIAQERS